jgi:glycosyltransferase involved in cell wall biosynthesis
MQIAVYLADQNPHRDRSLGITKMTRCLLGALAQREPGWRLVTIESASSFSFQAANVRRVGLPWRTDGPVRRLLADHLHACLIPAGVEPDIWYYPKGYLPFFTPRKGPRVVTIHDTIIQHYADHYPRQRSAVDYRYWIGLLAATLRHADMVLTVSETARSQIEEFCIRHRIAPKPVRVVYEASEYESVTPPAWAEKQDYVVHCASDAPHKKTGLLLAWWRELEQAGYPLPRLKLIGGAGAPVRRLADGLQSVEWVDFLEEPAFIQMLGHARALLLPSEIEGFGLPALEACLLGTPVCYAAGTSVAELLDPVMPAGKFSLADRATFVESLQCVLSLTASEMARVRADMCGRFSKERFAERTADAFREVVAG